MAVSSSEVYARPHVRTTIAAIAPSDERERVDQHDTLAWVDSGAPLWLPNGGHVDVSLWYAFHGTVGMALRPDTNEFTDHRWFSFDEITPAGRFDPELPRFITKLVAHLDAPN